MIIKLSYVFLLIAVLLFIVKVVLYARYRPAGKDGLSHNVFWYRQLRIYRTASARQRKFMQQMNLLSSAIFFLLLAFVMVLLLRLLNH